MRRKQIKQTRSLPSEFPNGTFLKTEKGHFYVRSNVKRLRFITDRVLASWSPLRIVEASEADPVVEKMKIWSKMVFRDGSLLYSHANGKMYLISDGKRRPITNPFWLEHLGASLKDAVWVSQDEINLHEEGEPLT